MAIETPWIEAGPTPDELPHIAPLADELLALAEAHARAHAMTPQGVLSAVGLMTGVVLARAYDDPATARAVVDRVPTAALVIIERIRARRHPH